MAYEEIQIALPDDYTAYARWWPVTRPRGAVLYLHGIQSHAGWYARSAARLQNAGYAVLQPDRRGSGRNLHQRGHARNTAQLIEDARCCGTDLLNRSGLSDYHALGVSWGGKLVVALAQSDAPVNGLTLVCPGLFPRIDVSSGEKIRIGLSMLASPQRLHDIPLNDPALFTCVPEWIDFLEQDTLRLHQVTASFFLASRRMDYLLRDLSSPRPLHVMLAENDAIIDNERTILWARELNWPHIRITHYADSRHTLEFEPAFEAYCDDLLEGLGR